MEEWSGALPRNARGIRSHHAVEYLKRQRGGQGALAAPGERVSFVAFFVSFE